jgi:uncharacterized membrane protein YhaH (DUF805 family)
MPHVNLVYLLTDVHGRISRLPFVIGLVVLVLIEIIAGRLALWIQGDRLAAVVDLAFTYPEFALSVKRANDRNIPVVVLAIFFVANAVIDFLQLIGLDISAEQQNPFVLVALLAFGAYMLVLAIELVFRRGTVGPNQFGPDPLPPGS